MFAYYSGVFGIGEQPFVRMFRKTAITKLIVMSFVCFILTGEMGVYNLFFPSLFRVFRDEGRLCANKGVVVPISRKMKANTISRILLQIPSGCEADPVAALLAWAWANEIDWTDSKALGWYLYTFASDMITAVLE